MRRERGYTPFDGKKNNWLEFARKQEEFYRYAGQYMVNLKIDIEELKDEIYDIEDELEEKSCSPAKGYKLFQKLRDVRQACHEKEVELECMHALTDFFNCRVVLNTCQENLAEVEDILEREEEKVVAFGALAV